MKIAECSENHKASILDILNEVIINSTALYDYKPRTLEMMDSWLEAKRNGNYPIIGAFDEKENLLGFGSYGVFRNFPAYKYTVEHSIYIDRKMRGKGIGKKLLREVIQSAEIQGYHVLVAVIDAANEVSIRMHEKAGFKLCGKIEQVGFKFGKWLDLYFYQLILNVPAFPTDG